MLTVFRSPGMYHINMDGHLRQHSVIDQILIYVPVTVGKREIRMVVRAEKSVRGGGVGRRIVAMTPQSDASNDVICMRGQLGNWIQRNSSQFDLRIQVGCNSKSLVDCQTVRLLSPFIIVRTDESAYVPHCR